uniref:Uncharacterized protein n=1 Tax=Avena sativa TaxID=4498 RepID=A0ACD5U9V3_AVESA
MRISYFLLPILLFHGFPCVAFAAAVADDQFSFSGFRDTDLNLDGTATVTPEGLLELTNGSVQLKGHAFFPAPFRLRGSPGGAVQSFSASFVFGIVSTYPSLSCHGIAFVVAPSKNFSTALAAQYMGLANIDNNGNVSNHIFATELDTMQNIEFEDIDNNHVGVNIDGLRSVQSHAAGYYGNSENDSFQSISLISGSVMRAWVDYDGELARIDVTIAPVQMSKPARPLVSATYNLSVVLTEQQYIGFSSATGPINSRHYILGWSFGVC